MNSLFYRSAIAIAIATLSQAASAFDVMGCQVSVGAQPNDVRRCIEGKANDRVRDASSALQRSLDEARRAKDEADRRAREAQQRLENDPFLARAAGEKQMLQTFREAGLENVFACLRASGAEHELLATARAIRANPGSAGLRLLERSLQVSETTLARIRDDNIRVAETLGLDELRRTLGDPERQLRMLADLQPGARCLMQYLSPATLQLQAQMPGLRQLATASQTRLAAGIRAPAERMAARQIQALFTAAMSGIRPALYRPGEGGGGGGLMHVSDRGERVAVQVDEATTKFVKEMVAIEAGGIASKVFTRNMLLPGMQGAGAAVNRYAVALAAQNPSRAAVDAAADAANAALDMRVEHNAAMQVDIGMGILKSLGVNYIHNDGVFFGVIPGGGMIIDTLYASIATGVDTALNVGQGAAGLVPEVGSGAVAVPRIVHDAAKEFAGNAITWGMKKVIAKVFEDFMDETAEVLKMAAGPELDRRMNELRARYPMFTGLMDGLQRDAIVLLADANLKELQRGVKDYNESVRNLVRATRSGPQ